MERTLDLFFSLARRQTITGSLSPPLLLVEGKKNPVVNTTLIQSCSSFIRRHHRRGGFSATRYARLREGDIDHYLNQVIESSADLFSSRKSAPVFLFGTKDEVGQLGESKRGQKALS